MSKLNEYEKICIVESYEWTQVISEKVDCSLAAGSKFYSNLWQIGKIEHIQREY